MKNTWCVYICKIKYKTRIKKKENVMEKRGSLLYARSSWQVCKKEHVT